jgi:hypothetical protein
MVAGLVLWQVAVVVGEWMVENPNVWEIVPVLLIVAGFGLFAWFSYEGRGR